MPVAAGSALVFNGVANQFYSTKLPFREDCLSHETYPDPVTARLSATNPTVLALFDARPLHHSSAARSRWRWIGIIVDFGPLPEMRLVEGNYETSEHPFEDVRGHLPQLPGGRPARTRQRHRRRRRHFAGRSLASVGIPAYDIVRVDGPEGSGFFLLDGDRLGIPDFGSHLRLRSSNRWRPARRSAEMGEDRTSSRCVRDGRSRQC